MTNEMMNTLRAALAAAVAESTPATEAALVEALSALDRGSCLADFEEEVTDLLEAEGFSLREEAMFEGSSSFVAWLERGWHALGVVSTITLNH